MIVTADMPGKYQLNVALLKGNWNLSFATFVLYR